MPNFCYKTTKSRKAIVKFSGDIYTEKNLIPGDKNRGFM